MTTVKVFEKTGVAINASINAATTISRPNEGAAAPTDTKIPTNGNEGGLWADWGANNCWPTTIRRKLEKSTIALSTIYKLVAIMYGNGLKYYQLDYDKGKAKKVFLRIPEIDEFIRRSRLNRFFIHQMVDYRFFMNSFSELIFNRRGDKINRILHLEAEYTRLGIQDSRCRINNISYSGKWQEGTPIRKEMTVIPNISRRDPYGYLANNKKPKVAWHSFMPSPGKTYYACPYWCGIFQKDGWLDNANAVPKSVAALSRNQVRWRYHIKIPASYWNFWFADWESYSIDKKKEAQVSKQREYNKFLSDPKNDCATFLSTYGVDPITNKAIPGFEIEAIDDKVKANQWIPTADKANQEILHALGADPSLLNLSSDGKLTAGSGSDKRVGLTNSQALMKVEEQILLEQLYMVAEFNGWMDKYPGLCFGFDRSAPTTLDKNPTGTQNEM